MGFLANFTKASETFSNNVLVFQDICELYKSVLDKNYGGRFCIGEHCQTIYMIEIKFDGYNWGTIAKIFYSKAKAKVALEIFKQKYPFASEFRVVTRKEKEKG